MKRFWILIFIVGMVLGYIISEQVNNRNIKIDTPITSYNETDNTITDRDFQVKIPIVVAADEIGMIGSATFRLVPGSGKILFESQPAIEQDIQYSAIIAIAYAEEYTQKKLNNNDIIIDFDMPLDVMGGVSAGAPITIGTIALLENKKLNQSIVLTGTINPDGTIGRVGEIREKTFAARDSGHAMIIVPPGQSRIWRQNYTLQELMNNTIIVKEASNINQALEFMIIN